MSTEAETPWAVICPSHGKQFLTKENYDAQISRPDSRWQCPFPKCIAICEWDDDNYERYLDDE